VLYAAVDWASLAKQWIAQREVMGMTSTPVAPSLDTQYISQVALPVSLPQPLPTAPPPPPPPPQSETDDADTVAVEDAGHLQESTAVDNGNGQQQALIGSKRAR